MNNSNKKLHRKQLALYINSGQLNRGRLMPQIATKLLVPCFNYSFNKSRKITHGKNKHHCFGFKKFSLLMTIAGSIIVRGQATLPACKVCIALQSHAFGPLKKNNSQNLRQIERFPLR